MNNLRVMKIEMMTVKYKILLNRGGEGGGECGIEILTNTTICRYSIFQPHTQPSPYISYR